MKISDVLWEALCDLRIDQYQFTCNVVDWITQTENSPARLWYFKWLSEFLELHTPGGGTCFEELSSMRHCADEAQVYRFTLLHFAYLQALEEGL